MRALVVGAMGMDGRLMTAYLLGKGYEVIGTYNRTMPTIKNEKLRWVKLDLSDDYALNNFKQLFPLDEIYNFGGVTFSPTAIDMPDYTLKANYHTPLAMIEYVVKHHPKTKFFQASSSEVFGNVSNQELRLDSPRKPHTPYSYAKNMVDFGCLYFRIKGGLVYNAISFNHDHFFRKPHFLIRKITTYVAQKKLGQISEPLYLGNITAKRDWSRATNFIDGYYKQMQGEPSELIFASGQCHSVEDILEIAFRHVNLSWQNHVEIDHSFIRLDERNNIWGDCSEAIKTIKFKPDTSRDFKQMITTIVDHDYLLYTK